jgi:hypothetical protein
MIGPGSETPDLKVGPTGAPAEPTVGPTFRSGVFGVSRQHTDAH